MKSLVDLVFVRNFLLNGFRLIVCRIACHAMLVMYRKLRESPFRLCVIHDVSKTFFF